MAIKVLLECPHRISDVVRRGGQGPYLMSQRDEGPRGSYTVQASNVGVLGGLKVVLS